MLDLLQDQLPDQEHLREHCLAVLNALMTCKPFGLIEPVDATKKLRKRIVYDSPDETYRLRTGMTIGVFTPLTKCYVDGCEPGQGGCYAPRCPNKPAVQETDLLASKLHDLLYMCTNIRIIHIVTRTTFTKHIDAFIHEP